MKLKSILTATALVLSAAGMTHAGVVLSDNFNSDTQALDWPGDSVFTSVAVPQIGGQVSSTDLIGPGFYNYCQAGQGNCVDLDGSSGSGNNPAGELLSTSSIGAGTYTLTFDLSGNDRGAAAQTTDVLVGGSQIWTSGALASASPWTTYSVTFTTAGGALEFYEEGPSDNQGNLLDNISVSTASTTTGVPEPAAWALMLVGLGGVGALLRRRHVIPAV